MMQISNYDVLIKEAKEATSYDMAPSGSHSRDLVRSLVSALERAVADRELLLLLHDFSKVTRVRVVPSWRDAKDFPREYWADSWKLVVQDEGCTLKLFGTGTGNPSRGARDRALAANIAADGEILHADD